MARGRRAGLARATRWLGGGRARRRRRLSAVLFTLLSVLVALSLAIPFCTRPLVP